jgi:undecaprenyl-diphosphatase
MPLLHLVILAIVQGITEFLPISSSAHLALVPYVMGDDYQGIIVDLAAHAGTLLAIVLYCWRDVWGLTLALGDWTNPLRRTSDRSRLLGHIIIATIPSVIIGALLYKVVNDLRMIGLMATTLIIFGLLLWWADRRIPTRTINSLTWREALMAGMAQALALIPGVSRSGITITAGRFLGLDRTQAARLSFLLALPATAAAVSLGLFDVLKNPSEYADQWLILGTVASLSFVTGLGVMHGLMHFIKRHSYTPFVIYRVALGLGLYAMLLFT